MEILHEKCHRYLETLCNAIPERSVGSDGNRTEGAQWVQGDHMIFIQNGCPAIAVSSKWFTEGENSQAITHTSKDNLEIVDCQKVVEVAEALNMLIRRL